MYFEPFAAGEKRRERISSLGARPSQPVPASTWSSRSKPKVTLSHKGVSVLFSDIVGFTGISHRLPPQVTMRLLHELFVTFDQINQQNNTYKVETIGDVSILLFTCNLYQHQSCPTRMSVPPCVCKKRLHVSSQGLCTRRP